LNSGNLLNGPSAARQRLLYLGGRSSEALNVLDCSLARFRNQSRSLRMFSSLTNGISYARAVESDLEAAAGSKPQVGFNWRNGRLVTVTVTFPRLHDAKPLRDVAETVRAAVSMEVKQTPEDIVLVFSLGIPARERWRNGAGWISCSVK
jgi:hypothetical protein